MFKFKWWWRELQQSKSHDQEQLFFRRSSIGSRKVRDCEQCNRYDVDSQSGEEDIAEMRFDNL